MSMELILNVIGALVALALVCLWLRTVPHASKHRRTQIVALAVLILILFPVISVTDDLLTVQNPADPDSCLRKVRELQASRQILPMAFVLPPNPTVMAFGFMRLAEPSVPVVLRVDSPALASVESRPPPTA
jgi:hypothetical protein